MAGYKSKIQNVFHFFGFEISRYPKKNLLSKRDRDFATLLRDFNIDLILDVGAANGGYASWLRLLGYTGRIISFEPLKSSYFHLQEKSSKDSLWASVNVALGECEDVVDIHVAANSDSSSILPMLPTHEQAAPHAKVTHTERIKKVRLDTFVHEWLLNSKHPFLKMDVQGYEKQVLEGAGQLLQKISGIQIEMSLVPLYEGQLLFDDMIKYMTSQGFEIFYIRPGFTSKEGRLLQCDGIFFRK